MSQPGTVRELDKIMQDNATAMAAYSDAIAHVRDEKRGPIDKHDVRKDRRPSVVLLLQEYEKVESDQSRYMKAKYVLSIPNLATSPWTGQDIFTTLQERRALVADCWATIGKLTGTLIDDLRKNTLMVTQGSNRLAVDVLLRKIQSSESEIQNLLDAQIQH